MAIVIGDVLDSVRSKAELLDSILLLIKESGVVKKPKRRMKRKAKRAKAQPKAAKQEHLPAAKPKKAKPAKAKPKAPPQADGEL